MKRNALSLSVAILISACFGGLRSDAQSAMKGPSPSWVVVPGVIRPTTGGKYSPTMTLVLFSSSCQRDSSTKAWTLANQTFTLSASGAGIQLSTPMVGDCRLTTTATIDPAVQPDKYEIVVSTQSGTSSATRIDQGYGDLNVLGPLAGPTPSTPEVDVEWNVLSHQTCSDSFGNRVANTFYCVQVTIGNNSAYKLQISTIAFKTKSIFADSSDVKYNINPNTSYQTTRSVAQAGQTLTARNLIFNSLGATGLIMASFTPYFHNPFNVSRWSTGAAIVSGTFTSAMSLVAPDLTVRELNNLDDQSLRDGKMLNNNTQNPPFDIFVDKREVRPELGRLDTYYNEKWKGTKDAGQVETLAGLNKCVRSRGNEKDCDPDYVKEAMGALVLSGHKIDYMERIVVDSSVTSQEVQAPSVLNATQLSVTADGNQQIIQITGANLSAVTDASSPDTGVAAGKPQSNSDGSLSVPVTVDKAFNGGSFRLLLRSSAGTATVTVQVKPSPSTPAKPSVSNASGLSVTADGNQKALVLDGTALDQITGVSQVGSDSNIQVGTASITATSISVPVTVSSGFSGSSFTLKLACASGDLTVTINVSKPHS